MSIRRQIVVALGEAQKARDHAATATLRLVSAALKDRDVAARSGGAGRPIPDEQILDLLARMVRRREEAAGRYRAGGQPDLADREEAEIGVIRRFMPRRMSAEEVATAVDGVIAETGATGLRDMGRVMAVVRRRYPGRIDGAAASALVKRRLG